ISRVVKAIKRAGFMLASGNPGASVISRSVRLYRKHCHCCMKVDNGALKQNVATTSPEDARRSTAACRGRDTFALDVCYVATALARRRRIRADSISTESGHDSAPRPTLLRGKPHSALARLPRDWFRAARVARSLYRPLAAH